jgi:hypothetical protein
MIRFTVDSTVRVTLRATACVKEGTRMFTGVFILLSFNPEVSRCG